MPSIKDLRVSPAAAPVRTTAPSRRMVTSSATDSTSSRKCDTYTTVTPRSASVRTVRRNARASSEVRRAVGSSMTMSSALRAKDRRISTFCWSATVRRPTVSSGPMAMPDSARRWAKRSDAPSTNGPRCDSMPRNTFSTTDRDGTRDSSWATIVMPQPRAARGDLKETSIPRTASRPASGVRTPAMIFPTVDLPAPFSPTMAWTAPARIAMSTPASATVPPNLLVTPRSSTCVRGSLSGTIRPTPLRSRWRCHRTSDRRWAPTAPGRYRRCRCRRGPPPSPPSPACLR